MKKLELLRLLRSHIQDRCWYEQQTSQQTRKDQTHLRKVAASVHHF